MKTLQEKLSALPATRRKRIAKRLNQLIAAEMTMQELRKARKITQVSLAKILGVKQEQISRIEKRTDMHISTLKRSIEAMGGSLVLIAEFPNGAPVKLTGFAAIEP